MDNLIAAFASLPTSVERSRSFLFNNSLPDISAPYNHESKALTWFLQQILESGGSTFTIRVNGLKKNSTHFILSRKTSDRVIFWNEKLVFLTFYGTTSLKLALVPPWGLLQCFKPCQPSWLTAPLWHSAKMTVCLLHWKKKEAVLRAAWWCLSGQTLAMQSSLLSVCDRRGSREPGVLLRVPRHFLIAALASALSLQCPRGNGTFNYYSFVPIRDSC